jgi:acyl-ACP thioesterase
VTQTSRVWEETHVVDTFDADWTGQATIQFICRAMQETAWHHATSIGFGLDHMQRNGIIWILSRQQIRVRRLPEWRDSVTVRTWYADREKLIFHRDFEVLDADGGVLVSVATGWLAVDLKRRRPVRSASLDHSAPAERPRAVDEPWESLPDLPTTHEGPPFRVFARDLDMSGHANNVNYPEWLLESLPLDHRSSHELVSLDVIYQAEATHGEMLTPHLLADGPGRYLHRIVRSSDGRSICAARSAWRKLAASRPTGWLV